MTAALRDIRWEFVNDRISLAVLERRTEDVLRHAEAGGPSGGESDVLPSRSSAEARGPQAALADLLPQILALPGELQPPPRLECSVPSTDGGAPRPGSSHPRWNPGRVRASLVRVAGGNPTQVSVSPAPAGQATKRAQLGRSGARGTVETGGPTPFATAQVLARTKQAPTEQVSRFL